jgi:hypothetical protein
MVTIDSWSLWVGGVGPIACQQFQIQKLMRLKALQQKSLTILDNQCDHSKEPRVILNSCSHHIGAKIPVLND